MEQQRSKVCPSKYERAGRRGTSVDRERRWARIGLGGGKKKEKDRGMYEPIGTIRSPRTGRLDRGLTSPANNPLFIPVYANDFVEEELLAERAT